MSDITIESRIAKNDEIVSGKIDDDLVMMSIQSGKYFLMNPTGGRIWELLDKPRTIAEISAILTGEYKIEPAACQKEVIGFIAQLASRKVITIS